MHNFVQLLQAALSMLIYITEDPKKFFDFNEEKFLSVGV